MPENLWETRRRKKMKVRDLAAKSGVPASVIHQYEAGEKPISQAHLRQLARALIVDTWDIKPISDPKPRTQRPSSTQPAPSKTGPSPEPRPAKEPKPGRPPAPARPTQIEHLLNLAERFPDVDRGTLEAQAGKTLEELMTKEASGLLNQLQKRLREEQPPRVKQPFDRHRAYLPEGVDEFELKYLTVAQEAGDILHVTLFDGSQLEGLIAGFGPYSITLRNPDGEETTVNKLAIAYYRKKRTDQ
jgi:transcriptional regulator with XRE-family HTH domain